MDLSICQLVVLRKLVCFRWLLSHSLSVFSRYSFLTPSTNFFKAEYLPSNKKISQGNNTKPASFHLFLADIDYPLTDKTEYYNNRTEIDKKACRLAKSCDFSHAVTL